MIVPGLYEHWKSRDDDPKFYAVLGAISDVNGKEMPVVAYAALYRPHGGKIVYRALLDPDDGFLAPIDRKDKDWNYKGPRFLLHQRLRTSHIAYLIDHAGEVARLKSRGGVLRHMRDHFH